MHSGFDQFGVPWFPRARARERFDTEILSLLDFQNCGLLDLNEIYQSCP